MSSQQRKLLEQLMSDQPKYELTDPRICRGYILGTCIHDMFANTRSDHGPCNKIHGLAYKTQFETAPSYIKRQMEREYAMDLEAEVAQVDQRVAATFDRLMTIPEHDLELALKIEHAMDAWKSASDKLYLDLREIEALGKNGLVDQAQQLYSTIESDSIKRLQQKTVSVKQATDPSTTQKLLPCSICGFVMGRLDNDKRLLDHFTGKSHIAHEELRALYDKFKHMR